MKSKLVIENHPNPGCGGSRIGFCYGNRRHSRELAGDVDKGEEGTGEKGTGAPRICDSARYPAG
jgi:hypothetical protein